ncbi:MAG: nucleotidyltransferase domain-containing protein [Candidatus Margulisiibacteriota bacterium]
MEDQFDIEKIKGICGKYGIDLLIIHGSYSKGTHTKDSDIDIGILGISKKIKGNYSEIIKSFSGVFGDKFDPVFLNGAEPLITFQVAMNGKVLYEREKGLFGYFKVKAIGRYLDSKKFRDLERNYIKSAIKGAVPK